MILHCSYENSFSLIVVLIHSQNDQSNYIFSFVRILYSCFKWIFIEWYIIYILHLLKEENGKREKKLLEKYFSKYLSNLIVSHNLQLLQKEKKSSYEKHWTELYKVQKVQLTALNSEVHSSSVNWTKTELLLNSPMNFF